MTNNLKEKILLILLSGVAFGCSYTAQKQYKVLKFLGKEWQKINKNELKREIRNLYRSKLIKEKKNSDGSLTFILSEKGKLKALTYHFDKMKIEKNNWDGKWRIVVFDVPEKLRRGRDALREKIKKLGFYELQKSVFVFPYNCKDEIDFIIEFFGIRKYVRYGVLDYIDNELHLKNNFRLK
ncbi:MAG: CRISPR-associated endonuclease Cas2 [Patescibacteria group bacterium]